MVTRRASSGVIGRNQRSRSVSRANSPALAQAATWSGSPMARPLDQSLEVLAVRTESHEDHACLRYSVENRGDREHQLTDALRRQKLAEIQNDRLITSDLRPTIRQVRVDGSLVVCLTERDKIPVIVL